MLTRDGEPIGPYYLNQHWINVSCLLGYMTTRGDNYREPQPHVVENYSYLINLRPNIDSFLCLNNHLIPINSKLIG